jgi:hypothetical protein
MGVAGDHLTEKMKEEKRGTLPGASASAVALGRRAAAVLPA